MSGAFYRFARRVMQIIMPLCYKIKHEGRENLPKEGGYLFISNHRSFADAILIPLMCPKQRFFILAKQELFQHGAIGWLLKNLGAVAVDRGAGDLSPLQELSDRLREGENALIFPEGTRSKDGRLARFKSGAALIAAQTGVPVVPIGISFKGEKLHFRSRITVRIGAPFTIPQTTTENPSVAVLKSVRQEMTQHVCALLPEEAQPARTKLSEQKGDLNS